MRDTQTVPFDDRWACPTATIKSPLACIRPASLALSSINPSPANDAVVAEGVSVVAAGVVIRDDSGVPTAVIGPETSLAVAVAGTPDGVSCSVGDFDASFGWYPVVCASTAAGVISLSATLEGNAVPGSVSFRFLPGPMDMAQTGFDFPSVLANAGTARFVVSFADAFGNAVTERTVETVAVEWTPEPEFESVVVEADEANEYAVAYRLPGARQWCGGGWVGFAVAVTTCTDARGLPLL